MSMANDRDIINIVNFKADPLYPESDYLEAHSDIEQLPRPSSIFDSPATDYWFGKRYFEVIIAQEVFHQASSNISMSAIDSQFERSVRTFPYHEANRSLQSGIPRFFRADDISTSKDDYYLLMILAGTVARRGTAQEKHYLIATVKNLVGMKIATSEETSSPRSTVDEPAFGAARFGSKFAPTKNEPEVNNSKYTSLLKDRADLRGTRLDANSYHYIRNTNDPDMFKAILTFEGCTFEGSARTKKGAKHEASKAACEYLDGQTEHMRY